MDVIDQPIFTGPHTEQAPLSASDRVRLGGRRGPRILRAGGKRRDAALQPIIDRLKADMLALALANGAVRKFDPSEPRDEAGRWTASGSAYEARSPEMKAALAAFATMPKTALKSASAQKWFAANADLYASNKEFRTLIAASSAYVQGHFGEIRGAAVYGMTGVMPPADGMNEQAWRGYMEGTRWRSDLGSAEATRDDLWTQTMIAGGRAEVVDGRVVSTEWHDPALLGLAPDIMSYAKAEGDDGRGPHEGRTSDDKVTYATAGMALNEAIAAADPIDATLYRGLRLNEQGYQLNADGTLVVGAGSRFDYNPDTRESTRVENPGTPYLSVGQTLDLMGPTSFTASADIAERISAGRQQMGDIKPAAGRAALVFQVDQPQAINVGAVSPYRQAEYLTSGQFAVTNIAQSWVTAGYNVYSPRWNRPETIPLYTVTLQQVGTWQPPT